MTGTARQDFIFKLNTHTPMTRRDFLAAAATIPAITPFATATHAKPKLKKAVKLSMVSPKGATTLDKFELVKKIGFEGVEIDSPSGVNKIAAKRAAEKTGIAIHGVIDNLHWTFPLSSPDANVRAEGLAALEGALEDAKFYGADTVLLVPGVARGGVTYEQCFERSQAEVRKAIGLAEESGGTVLTSSSDLAALLETMPPITGDSLVTRQPIWDSPWLWLLIVGLLAAEWSLRRLAGYG